MIPLKMKLTSKTIKNRYLCLNQSSIENPSVDENGVKTFKIMLPDQTSKYAGIYHNIP